jgi:hypothetical protein
MYNGWSYRYRAISSRQPLDGEESKKKVRKEKVRKSKDI